MSSEVSISLQNTDDGRGIIAAIVADNPKAKVSSYPAMTKIDCPDRLVMNRSTIEQQLGREFDLHELNLTMISISGNVDEDDDRLLLMWNS
ncbi:Phenol hydroxylase P2 protein [Methylocella tundrae]|jgi:phenol hydroxylase P2 protein|uniref:Phenol hydroxylase P2 protein n=1 Tax=Methylocella tundrae TaxID=227605 RepID=A0A4U8Z670_METTU|nr:MmoB/DmpM family protein [Methylocella tundrae]WPP04404.1 MmoB/DmpM family protein [Methylocella tundrae]VFU10763.1 Phenol hydroxylase P2 protein [Methylocella tundrae]VTZ23437.1 Phenol hydroxylase P2 protein [Methylocella tundrae]VTZ50811.1 Phenol hydroxylase P2 protein [Methylocella tundrae]